MNYAVYIALPRGEGAEAIVEAASAVVLPGRGFSVRDHADPNAASDGELFLRVELRVEDVSLPEEALAEALQVYEAARKAAGLRRDGRAAPSLEPVARAD